MFLAMRPVCAGGETVNRVVAVVNEEVITQQDVDQILALVYAQYVQAYKGDELLAMMEDLKKNVLEQIIDDKLILSRAKELDITVTEEEIDERLAQVKAGFPSEQEFLETISGTYDLMVLFKYGAILQLDQTIDQITGIDCAERTLTSIVLARKFQR